MAIDGSFPPLAMNAPPAGAGISSFAISPDGSRIAYVADQEQASVLELFSVGAGGPGSGGTGTVKLNPPLAPGGGVVGPPRISPDSSRVVYRADQVAFELVELWSVPLAGGAAVRLNPPLAAGGDVAAAEITADSARVVYVADQDQDERLELYAVPLAGGAGARLSGVLVAGGDVRLDFDLAPDGSRVVYRADEDTDEQLELFSAATSGAGAPVELGPSLAPAGDVDAPGAGADSVEISADGARVAFLADVEGNGVVELFAAPIAGGSAAARLSGTLSLREAVLTMELASGAARVVYRADQETNEVFELWSAPLAGGAPPVRLNAPFEPGAVIGSVAPGFAVVPGGRGVVYVSDQDTDELGELYHVPASGGREPVKKSGPLVGSLQHLSLAPDGSRALYHDVVPAIGPFDADLFSVALAGAAAPTQLDAPTHAVLGSRVDPTSAWVVYRAQGPGGRQLYTVPIDGGAAPLLLSAPAVPTGEVLDFALHPHAARAAFRADRELDQRVELYLAGGGAVAKVNLALPTGGDVDGDYAFTALGRLVYRAEQEQDERHELYSAATGPLGTPVRLSGPLASGGDVLEFRADPSGARVVYRADQDFDGRVELWGAPADGSAPARKLHPTLPAGRNVDSFEITPDGARAVYLADPQELDAVGVFAVPLAAGAPVRLDVHGAASDVVGFAVAPDSSRVLFVADAAGDDVFRLFVAPIDGSAPPLELSHPLAPGHDVQGQWIDPDSELALYRAGDAPHLDLFAVPLDGSRGAVRLHERAPLGGVRDHVAFAGGRAVYRAFAGDVDELWSSALPRRAASEAADGSAVR